MRNVDATLAVVSSGSTLSELLEILAFRTFCASYRRVLADINTFLTAKLEPASYNQEYQERVCGPTDV